MSSPILDLMSEVTRILMAIDQGEPHAAEQLLPLVYDELRRLAARYMEGEKAGQTFDPTALVHEAYLRLVGDQKFENRGHFFAAAAQPMRRILIDRARQRQSKKRRGGRVRSDFDPDCIAAPDRSEVLLALDEALERLAAHDLRKAKLVELRYFAGLPLDLVANVLGISSSTADRDWAYARAWLHREISKNS
jgi:RNA polymerase sigma factor (TIGR02999 family)